MKIVCLQASPRPKSNSAALAQSFLDAAGGLGAQVSSHRLNDLHYRGCQACMACKTKLDKCALKDDLAPVLAEIQACDVLVLASPVYFGELCSQLKACIDRTYSFLKPDYLTNPQPVRLAPGKVLVMALPPGRGCRKLRRHLPPLPLLLRLVRLQGLPFAAGMRGARARRGLKPARGPGPGPGSGQPGLPGLGVDAK